MFFSECTQFCIYTGCLNVFAFMDVVVRWNLQPLADLNASSLDFCISSPLSFHLSTSIAALL